MSTSWRKRYFDANSIRLTRKETIKMSFFLSLPSQQNTSQQKNSKQRQTRRIIKSIKHFITTEGKKYIWSDSDSKRDPGSNPARV
jgi:transposase-like protein